MESVYVEMNPGDCLFLHANTLHRSKANHSEQPRWAMLASYNAVSNAPFKYVAVPHVHSGRGEGRRLLTNEADVCLAVCLSVTIVQAP